MVITAPETGLQPLFGIPDLLDNSNPTTPMEADSGGYEANTSPAQSKAQSMPQSGSSSEEAASLTSGRMNEYIQNMTLIFNSYS